MIQLIQIAIIVFALFAWSRAILRFKDGKVTGKELIFWSVIWASGIFLVIYPDVTFFFAKLLGIDRGADVMIYLSVVLLFYLIFRILVKIETVEHNVTKIVREIAIEKETKKKTKRK